MKEFIRIALTSIAVAAAVFGVVVAAALWAPQDQPTIRRHLVEAIASGELVGTKRFGPFFNNPVYKDDLDCLIFGMMVAPAGGRLVDAISNRYPRTAAPIGDPRVQPFPDCNALLHALPELGGDGRDVIFVPYDRYILGMRIVGRVLLSFMPLQTMQQVLLGAAYSLLGLIALVTFYRLRRANGDARAHARAAGYLGISGCLAFFYGAHYFDATLFFSPLDCTHYAFILISLIWAPTDMRPAVLAAFASAYGSLVAVFEFFTGGIPLALALLPLLLALGFHGRDRRAYFVKLATLWAGFCLGLIVCVAIKKAVAVGLFGDTDSFTDALLNRISGDLTPAKAYDEQVRYSLWYLLGLFRHWSGEIAWGSSDLGSGLIIVSLTTIAIVTWRNRATIFSFDRPVRPACLLSLVPLISWIAVFPNHTILHAYFMTRLLVIPIVAGTVLAVTEFWRPERGIAAPETPSVPSR